MKIIVCLKETVDAGLNLEPGLRHGVVFRGGLPLLLNPDDAAALSLALGLRSLSGEPPVEIILVSIGPERVENYLRQGLALGADKALRITSEGMDSLSPYRKAMLLAGAVSMLDTNIILTGAKSLDNGSGQTGPLLAARLGFPCVIDTIDIETEEDMQAVKVTRDIGRGMREKQRCTLPVVLAVKGESRLPYASLDKLIDGTTAEVELLTPADLGITPAQMEYEPLRVTGPVQPRPRTQKVPTPDSSLPAFYRILELLKGGISGRRGLMLEGDSEAIADRLYEILLEEGVLKSAKES
jgi:electron transfer flavoprotein alpha/beta subunit